MGQSEANLAVSEPVRSHTLGVNVDMRTQVKPLHDVCPLCMGTILLQGRPAQYYASWHMDSVVWLLHCCWTTSQQLLWFHSTPK